LANSPLAETASSTGFFPPTDSHMAKGAVFIIAGLTLVLLCAVELYSFLLFHVLIEIFSVVVAFAIFMFAWNTRDKIHNTSLTLLGAAYLAIGALDLLHTFSYKGMGVFENYGANTATQLWIAARYMESATLVVAPFLVARKIPMERAVAVYGGLFALVIATVFVWPVFPVCYIEGRGLTPFKVVSEYVIIAALFAGMVTLFRRKAFFDHVVFRMLTASIVLTMISELMFTFYISVYGISNLVGHFFKLGSFCLIYKAIIETGLQQPYSLLFRELARSEKRYRQLVDNLPTGICEVDPEFCIRYINPSGLALIGYDDEDIRRGVHLSALLDSEGQDRAKKRLDDVLHDQPIESTGYRIRRKDGAAVEVLVNSIPIRRNGKLTAIQTSLTDVTELNNLQKCLQESRKMEAVAILAGGMAHEINNILMGVMGGIDVIRLEAADKDLSDADFEDVRRGCERIAELVRQLLAYSRGGRYRSEKIELSEFIKQGIAELARHLDAKIYLAYDPADDLPVVSADSLQLRRVLAEVIDNAEEAVGEDGRIDVSLRTREIDAEQASQQPGLQPGQYVCLSVHDNGPGMDKEILSHIFEPFFTTHSPGRGMGMAAVYGIVKNHGGWIGVDSRKGEGATVRIYLPVLQEVSKPAPKLQAVG